MVWIYIITVAILGIYSYMCLRKTFECGHVASQSLLLFLGIWLGLIAWGVYYIAVGECSAQQIAFYYILTFLGLVGVGYLVWNERPTNPQLIAIGIIVLGFLLWAWPQKSYK